MKIKIGVMGSAADTLPEGVGDALSEKAAGLGRAIGAASRAARTGSGAVGGSADEGGHELALLTGATTGIPYLVGRAAREAGTLHVGVSPASNAHEHTTGYGLPVDACDLLIYTGFGLKGRNVVLVRSCDIVIFIAGSIGSLNELTIAYDEGRVIGCLSGTGGVADEAGLLLRKLAKQSRASVFEHQDPRELLALCLGEVLRQAAGRQ